MSRPEGGFLMDDVRLALARAREDSVLYGDVVEALAALIETHHSRLHAIEARLLGSEDTQP